MLLLMLISSDCRLSRCRLQFDRKLQSTSHQLARARYKQLLSRRRTEMAKKGHKPEEIVAKRRPVDVLVSQGRSVADAIRAIGVTEVTYYRWRREFGGLKSDQVKRLKALEAENA